MHHRVEIGVGSQMLELCLRHMQVVADAELFEVIVGLEAFGGCAEVHKNLVRLFDIIDDRFIRQKLCQPSAVFGADGDSFCLQL